MQRTEEPKGREIAEMAKKMVRDEGKDVQGLAGDKVVRFLGAKTDHLKKEEDLEAGAVIGILENEATGDESGLPPGRYNICAAKVKGKWEVYAESGGEVKGKAARVTATRHKPEDKASPKSAFHKKGWCIYICVIPNLLPWGPSCFWSITHCW
jgi:hypothetical protein